MIPKITIKTSGLTVENLMSEMEKDAKDKLRKAGLSRVRVKVGKTAGQPSIHLDADTDDELARAAKVLGIKK